MMRYLKRMTRMAAGGASRLCCILALALAASAQQPPAASGRRPAAPSPESNAAAAKRLAAVQRVQLLADRAQKFQTDELKLRTLATLADILWQAEEDSARRLLLRCVELLKSSKPADSSSSAAANGNSNTARGMRANNFQFLRQFIIQIAVRRDPELAKLLTKDTTLFGEGQTEFTGRQNLDVAFDLARNGDAAAAAEFAQRGLAGGLTKGDAPLVLNLLAGLRARDEKAADELFRQTLARLAAQPASEVDALLIIGNYLFTNDKSAPALPASAVIVMPISLGRIVLAADLTVDRPGVSDELARGYLKVALQLLTRPAEPNDRARHAAAAAMLLPKTRRFAPELASPFTELAAAVALPQSSAKPAAGKSVEDVLRELDSMTDDTRRGESSLSQARSYYARGDFEAAGKVADRIKNSDARAKVLNLIVFRQASLALERGEVEAAEQFAKRLAPDMGRSLIRLALAQAYAAKGDRVGARAALGQVLKESATDSGELRQAQLLLAATKVSAQFDPLEGANLLRQTVKAFNSADGARGGERFGQVVVGSRAITFDTALKGVSAGDFNGALKPLAAADPDGTVAAVLQLGKESILSQALPALARALLQQ